MENKFMRAAEVAKELDVSVSFAYKVMKKLNAELKEKGFVTIAGRINRQYFYERIYGTGKEATNAGI
ncbi:MAG: LysR family transcriptional regulator [Clostridia bacterium]|nr:LysR family transcriptional regulator [Clostridia bacterium]